MRGRANDARRIAAFAAKGMLLATLFALSGCTLLEGDGEETVVVTNQDAQPVSTFLRITTEGGIPVFNEEVFLERRASREYPVALQGGIYEVRITTTNGISEFLRIEIPEKGDTRIDVTLYRGRATIVTNTR